MFLKLDKYIMILLPRITPSTMPISIFIKNNLLLFIFFKETIILSYKFNDIAKALPLTPGNIANILQQSLRIF